MKNNQHEEPSDNLEGIPRTLSASNTPIQILSCPVDDASPPYNKGTIPEDLEKSPKEKVTIPIIEEYFPDPVLRDSIEV